MRRTAAAVLAAAAVLVGAPSARAQVEPSDALVFVIEGSSLRRFVDRPPVVGTDDLGGIALLRGPDPTARMLEALRASGVPVLRAPVEEPRPVVSSAIRGSDEPLLVVVVGTTATEGDPDVVLMAWGEPERLATLDFDVPLSTLTSDSTRRSGVVTPADVAASIERISGVDVRGIDGGDPVRVVAAEPPLALFDRYRQYRSLSTPIQALVGAWEIVLGAVALWAMRRRWTVRRLALGATLSLPVLFLALLLVGHLPTLTYVSVLTSLAVVTAVAGVLLLRVAERSGVGSALAWAGGIGLAGLVLESALGWGAAFTPMLGGSHLDGARFFGMPNVEIGLTLGGATLVATQPRSTIAGSVLLAGTGIWAGSPWFGSNLGASITLFAAAGIWWGVRGERGGLRTGLAAAACVAAGVLLVVFAHRSLTDAPTHITRFVEDGGGIGGAVERAVHRLGIGLRLLRDQPPALIPVLGTPVALFVLLARPPARLLAGFAEEPSVRPAAITILLGSIVAYVANDTGAAALGLGFGVAMVCLFAVSLAAGREKMDA